MREIKFESIGDPTGKKTMKLDPNGWRQWTGLKDKNGKEIYEGDVIVLDGSKTPKVMEFRQGAFMLEGIYGGAEAYRMEVIGNVWENPDLLRDTKALSEASHKV